MRSRPTRRLTGSAVAATLVLALLASAAPAGASVPVVVVSGKGFGHGVGMAQDGARQMGVDGSTVGQILAHFYPGTGLGTGQGQVRVPVSGGADETRLTLPGGGEVRSSPQGPQAPGFPISLAPGETVTIRDDAGLQADTGSGSGSGDRSPDRVPPQSATIDLEDVASSQPAGESEEAPSPATIETLAPSPAQPPATVTSVPPSPAEAPPPTLAPLAPAPAQSTAPPAAPSSAPAQPLDPTPAEAPDTASAPTSTVTTVDQSEPDSPTDGAAASAGSSLWVIPAPGTTVALPDRGTGYRGSIEVVATDGTPQLVNHVDVEDYLRGMGEVRDSSWPAASLQAQAVAARTYALRAMSASGEICASQRCQVYLGAQAEYAAMDAAVAATRGQVVRYGGQLASTVYSANGGGVSATAQEGFGAAAGGAPYLQARTYATTDPAPWEVRIALSELGSRLGFPGLQSVRISETGPSGRATAVELTGASGPLTVSAKRFASALGLRSTLWTLADGEAVSMPPSPPNGDQGQAMPGESASDESLTYFPAPETAQTQNQNLERATAIAAPGSPPGAGPATPWGLYLGVFLVAAAVRRLFELKDQAW